MSGSSSTVTKGLGIAGGLVGTALLIWPIAIWLEIRRLEKPKYKQLITLGKETRALYDRKLAIDVREYMPYIVAEVTVKAENMKDATRDGFKQVAEFIFGGNSGEGKIAMTSPVQTSEAAPEKKGEKIAMTTPVATEMSSGSYKIAFVMPSKFKSKEDLPKPKNESVKLTEVPSHTLAAISWRGYPAPSEEVIKKKEEALRAALQEAGIAVEARAKTKVYQYWPPFAPGPIKEYDVLLPVTKDTVPASTDTSKTE